MLSAIALLATGIYIQVGFATLVSPAIRLVILAGVLVHFFLRLDQCATLSSRHAGASDG